MGPNKLKDKINKAKKLAQKFSKLGIKVKLNMSTGEINVPLSEFHKPEVEKLFRQL